MEPRSRFNRNDRCDPFKVIKTPVGDRVSWRWFLFEEAMIRWSRQLGLQLLTAVSASASADVQP